MTCPFGSGIFVDPEETGDMVAFTAGMGLLSVLDLVYFFYKKEIMLQELAQKATENDVSDVEYDSIGESDQEDLLMLDEFRLTLFVTAKSMKETIGLPLLIETERVCRGSGRFRLFLSFTKKTVGGGIGKMGRFTAEDYGENIPEEIERVLVYGPMEFISDTIKLVKEVGISEEIIYVG
mmetsp:Transcript_61593/g.70624  ORF Transcript_61593/g.70624 Transcript_61593/m.70624 type:complete len:179 (+) Transcript_61593:1-537(+)